MMKFTKLTALLLAGLCLLPLSACSDDTPDSTNDKQVDKEGNDKTPAEIDLAALKAQFISDLSVTDSVDIATDMLLDLYGIAAADVEESAGYMTLDGAFPDEVILVKAVDQDAAGRIADALTRRLEDVKVQAENYDPDNYALALKCKVHTTDLYVALFLSPHFDRMTELFNEAAN